MYDPQVAEHIARLKDVDANARRHAANALGEMGDTSAIPALIEALKNESDFVRR